MGGFQWTLQNPPLVWSPRGLSKGFGCVCSKHLYSSIVSPTFMFALETKCQRCEPAVPEASKIPGGVGGGRT